MGFPPKAINEVGLFTGTEVGSSKMIHVGQNARLPFTPLSVWAD